MNISDFLAFAITVQSNASQNPNISTKRRLSNERRNSILMMRHHPDLGSASDWLKRVGTSFQPIRSTTKIWVVTRHQYGISALVTQTSFCEGSSGDLAKGRLFSQAIAGVVSR